MALKFSLVSSVFCVFSDYSCLANVHLALNIDNGLDCLLFAFAPGTRELMYVNILKSLSINSSSSSLNHKCVRTFL